jgi:hypothetical protein
MSSVIEKRLLDKVSKNRCLLRENEEDGGGELGGDGG